MRTQGWSATLIAGEIAAVAFIAAAAVVIRGGMGLLAAVDPLPRWRGASALLLELAERMVWP